MPLLRFDVIEGRSDEELATLLDAAHRAMLAAFRVPASDRYQIVHEHKPSRLRIEDTGLGFKRTKNVVLLQVTSRPRSVEEKTTFYRLLFAELAEHCGIAPADVMVNFVHNTDADWSFGLGEAQFLTGKLGVPRQRPDPPRRILQLATSITAAPRLWEANPFAGIGTMANGAAGPVQ